MWGYHLGVDCAGCNGAIRDGDAIAAFAADVVATLGMRAYGPAQIVRFGTDPKVAGYTLVQLIETSNVTAHFCDHSGEAYIDIFSCKAYAVDAALTVIERHFQPTEVVTRYAERQAPLAAPQQRASA